MKNLLKWGAPLALLLCCWAPGALAQGGYARPATYPGSRPTVSPYLNITRSGNRALNYYNLVRPEFEFRNAYQRLQQQAGQQAASIDQINAEFLPATGHSTSFQNYSHFFPSLGGQGVVRTPGTPATQPPGRGLPTPRGGAMPRR
jgi:hypothetical protein